MRISSGSQYSNMEISYRVWVSDSAVLVVFSNGSTRFGHDMFHGFLQFCQIAVLQGFSPKSIVEQTQIYNQ